MSASFIKDFLLRKTLSDETSGHKKRMSFHKYLLQNDIPYMVQ